ncbi:TVP38/TMEM64 family protein [Tissierella carlieri]|uniref:TVP38/TMEM64 family protein n=1 Tax=Tissierella TaxID=41273 RepID=UPI0019131631|nr:MULTISPECIES: TVP38/TMEM64 family protein [Tissierella]MBU5311942.1 TVP38/TMEM64 family protein [Tissierella carlieri]MDU5080476.1 TVP38/TMEM64 family protein [Bacillota bacterium]
MKNIKKSTWIKLGVVLGLILIYFFVSPVRNAIKQIIFIFSMLDVDAVKGYILSFGIWAPIISFLLMVFQSVAAPLPAFLITFANAGLFGWVKGAILSWTSAMAGAALCFYISRIYGRNTAERLTSKFALEEIDGFFDRYGNYAILIARLLPFISFDIVSYAAGLTSMSFWSFFWATGLGQLPATIVYSYAGEKLTGGAKTFVTGLLILFAVSALGFLIKKIWNEKNKKTIN